MLMGNSCWFYLARQRTTPPIVESARYFLLLINLFGFLTLSQFTVSSFLKGKQKPRQSRRQIAPSVRAVGASDHHFSSLLKFKLKQTGAMMRRGRRRQRKLRLWRKNESTLVKMFVAKVWQGPIADVFSDLLFIRASSHFFVINHH